MNKPQATEPIIVKADFVNGMDVLTIYCHRVDPQGIAEAARDFGIVTQMDKRVYLTMDPGYQLWEVKAYLELLGRS